MQLRLAVLGLLLFCTTVGQADEVAELDLSENYRNSKELKHRTDTGEFKLIVIGWGTHALASSFMANYYRNDKHLWGELWLPRYFVLTDTGVAFLVDTRFPPRRESDAAIVVMSYDPKKDAVVVKTYSFKDIWTLVGKVTTAWVTAKPEIVGDGVAIPTINGRVLFVRSTMELEKR